MRIREYEITMREVLVSIIILLLMVGIGFSLDNKIMDSSRATVKLARTAIKVKDKETLDYVVDTQQGAFITRGDYTVKEPVKFPEMKDTFLYVSKEREDYVAHTRIVTDDKGNTHTEIYYSWDYTSGEVKVSPDIEIYGHILKVTDLDLPSSHTVYASDVLTEYKDSIFKSRMYLYTSSSTRYYYKVIPKTGTLSFLANANEKGISPLKGDKKINLQEQKMEDILYSMEHSGETWQLVFRIMWTLFTIGVIIGYVLLDNDYLK